MLKKGILSWCSLFLSLLMLCACGLDSLKDDRYITSDIQDYETIWDLPERRASETSSLFPDINTAKKKIDFVCEHTTYSLLGTGWQVELYLEFEEENFFEEAERIKTTCKGSPVFGENSYFQEPAYASVWNWECCFEYAILYEEEHAICYIYLQLIEPDAVLFDNKFLPKEYDMEMQSPSYSVYQEM